MPIMKEEELKRKKEEYAQTTQRAEENRRRAEEVLEKNKHREIIASFCIASNVTGIITPYEEISKILRNYNAVI